MDGGGRELGSVIKPLTYDAWTHKQVNTPKSELAANNKLTIITRNDPLRA